MLTKTDQPKSKDRASYQYPIDFVVPLQLEECVYRLGKQEWQPAFSVIVFTATIPDQRQFIATLERHTTLGTYAMQTKGTMRRWQGTSTRFEGTVYSAKRVKSESAKTSRGTFDTWQSMAFVFGIFFCGGSATLALIDGLSKLLPFFWMMVVFVYLVLSRLSQESNLNNDVDSDKRMLFEQFTRALGISDISYE